MRTGLAAVLLGLSLAGCDALVGPGATSDDGGAVPDAGESPSEPTAPAVTVDLIAPQVEITSGPAAVTPATNPRFEFRSNDESGIAELQCQLDSQGFAPCQSPLSYSGLALAAHAFEVKARDGAGNWGNPTTHAWQINLSPSTGYDQASS